MRYTNDEFLLTFWISNRDSGWSLVMPSSSRADRPSCHSLACLRSPISHSYWLFAYSEYGSYQYSCSECTLPLETFVLEALDYCVCIKWFIGFSIKGDNLYKDKCEAIACLYVCVCIWVFVCVCLCVFVFVCLCVFVSALWAWLCVRDEC